MLATLCQYVGFRLFDLLPSRLRPGRTTEEDDSAKESDTVDRSRASAAGSCGRAASSGTAVASTSSSSSFPWNSPVSSERATCAAVISVRERCGRPPVTVLPARALAGLEVLQLFQHLIQPQALDELHDVIRQAILLADAEDGDDIGVVQPGRRSRLALEPPLGPVVQQHAFGQHLERDVTPQRDLLGLVDNAHAALADFAEDAKITELLQGRGRRRRRAPSAAASRWSSRTCSISTMAGNSSRMSSASSG